MKTLLLFATLSLAVCLTLCLHENQKENDEEEVFEEILDREKRDAMPQPKGMHLYLSAVCMANAMLVMERNENSSNKV